MGLAWSLVLAAEPPSSETTPTKKESKTQRRKQETVISAQGCFTITLPRGFPTPEFEEKDASEAHLSINYDSKLADREITIMVMNNPAVILNHPDANPKEIFDDGRDGLLSKTSFKILENETDFQFDGYPARRFYLKTKDTQNPSFVRDEVILVKTRIYQVIFISNDRDDLDSPETNAFFESFHLTRRAVPDKPNLIGTPYDALKFKLPSDWIVQNQEPETQGDRTTLLDFKTKNEELSGLYMRMNDAVGDASIDKLISDVMNGIKTNGVWKNFKVFKARRMAWGGVRQDCRATNIKNDVGIYWSNVFVILNNQLYTLTVITTEDNKEQYQEKIDNFFDEITIEKAAPIASDDKPIPTRKRGLKFTLPSDWTIVNDQLSQHEGVTILQVFQKGEELNGLYMDGGAVGNAPVESLIDGFMKGIKSGAGYKNFKVLSATSLDWGGVRRDCRALRIEDNVIIYWCNVFINLNGQFYCISISLTEDKKSEYQDNIDNFFNGITIGSPTPAPQHDNPVVTQKKELKFALPADWLVKNKQPEINEGYSTLLDFQTADEGLKGLYLKTPDVGTTQLATLIDNFMNGVKGPEGHWKGFKVFPAVFLDWGGVRRDCRAIRPDDGIGIYWANAFAVLNGDMYNISIVINEDDKAQYKEAIDNFFESITVEETGVPESNDAEKVWPSERWHFSITLPGDWTMNVFDKAKGVTVAQFSDSTKDIFGTIAWEKKTGKNAAYLNAFLETLKESYDIEVLQAPADSSSAATAIYTQLRDEVVYQCYLRVFSVGGAKVRINFACPEDKYDEYQSVIEKYAKTFQPWGKD